MKIHYLQEINVKNYALIGKLWPRSIGYFHFSGVIGTQKNGSECFDKAVLEPGDRIYIAKNRPRNPKGPQLLLFVKKTEVGKERQEKLPLKKA